MIPGFGIKREQKTTKKETRRQRSGAAGFWERMSTVLGTFLVIPTKNSELQSISPPSLEAASCSIGTIVINCSTGTTVMTILHDQQLNSSWTAELLKSRTLVGSSFLYKYRGLSLR